MEAPTENNRELKREAPKGKDMAPLTCVHSHHVFHFSTIHYSCPSLLLQGYKGYGNNGDFTVSCKNIHHHQTSSCVDHLQQDFGTKRRELLLGGLYAAVSSVPALALAESVPEDSRFYTDEVNKFKILVPQDWQVGTGEGDGVRSLIAFYPPDASFSNVSIVITSLGADFTRLESFGKVDAFAENLVSGLDRSWQRPPGVAAKLIDSKAANGLYYIEYTLKNPGESRRHLLSVLGIANNGRYNRLYTLTGQFVDEEEEKYGSQIKKAVSSFRLI